MKQPYIGNVFDAPDYTIDNDYLYLGYRINFNTFSLALSTISF